MGMPVGRVMVERGTHWLTGSALGAAEEAERGPALHRVEVAPVEHHGGIVGVDVLAAAREDEVHAALGAGGGWTGARVPTSMWPSVPRRMEAHELSAKRQIWLLSAVVPVGQGAVAVAFWQSWLAIVDWRVVFSCPTRALMMAFFTGDQSAIPASAQVQALVMQQRASRRADAAADSSGSPVEVVLNGRCC